MSEFKPDWEWCNSNPIDAADLIKQYVERNDELEDVVYRFYSACKAHLPPAIDQTFCGLYVAAETLLSDWEEE